MNGLRWEHIPDASWSAEFGGRRVAIVRIDTDEALCTLVLSTGEGLQRVHFGPHQMADVKAQIIRFLGAAE